MIAVALAAAVAAAPIFQFHTDDFWLNLHQFLYVLGRAAARTPDSSREAVIGAPADAATGLASLDDESRDAWRKAVAFYAAGPSRQDAVFDAPLAAITNALASAGNRADLNGVTIDPALRAALDAAAPAYRTAWWSEHRSANERWRNEAESLIDKDGDSVLRFVTRAYDMTWPAAGYPVHVAAYANWAGAYSTAGNLLVVSSLDPELRGLAAVETLFHEGMHQWDDAVERELADIASRVGKRVPRLLSHALIFFTAGDAVRRAHPGYVPYADANGVWQRGMDPFRQPLDDVWKPHLDGRGTRREALTALLERLP